MNRYRFADFIVCIVCVLVLIVVTDLAIVSTHAQGRITWNIQSCGTLECVTEFLNKLPIDRAIEAKITTINSQRSFMGVLSDPYKIWYRK